MDVCTLAPMAVGFSTATSLIESLNQ
jgi:hypothetical protein